MDLYSGHMNKLIEELAGLPGIGSKSAQRLAFHLMNMPADKVRHLTDTVWEARQNVCYCKECFTMTDREICPVCANPNRDHGTIMVVETTVIWQPMRRPENTKGFIMYCMVPSRPCWESDRMRLS